MLKYTYTFLLLLFLSSCGQPEAYMGSHWLDSWDGYTWIVSTKSREGVKRVSQSLSQHKLPALYLNTPEIAPQIESFPMPARPLSPLRLQGRKPSGIHTKIHSFLGVRLPPQTRARTLGEKIKRHRRLKKKLERLPEVIYAEPSLKSKFLSFDETHIERMKKIEHMNTIRMIEAAEQVRKSETTLNSAIVVAVLDTGVDYTHPLLENRMYRNEGETLNGLDDDNNGFVDDIHGIDASRPDGQVFLPDVAPGHDVGGPGAACILGNDLASHRCGHGTHVAGIIAADYNAEGAPAEDNTVPTGICQHCRIMTVRISDRICKDNPDIQNDDITSLSCDPFSLVNGEITDLSQVRALNYIFNHRDQQGNPLVHIVNMSFGKYFRSKNLEALVSKVVDSGILLVAAAGNDDSDSPNYPAAYPNVFAVCATASSPNKERPPLSGVSGRGIRNKADFSNFGVWVDICAPGREIPSTMPGGTSAIKDGTSQASPVAAGAAGFLWGLLQSQTSNQNTIIFKEDIEKRLRYMAAGEKLYTSRLNIPYSGSFGTGQAYFLLGSGLLDVYSAAYSYETTFPTGKLQSGKLSLQFAERSGCVISSLHSRKHQKLKLSTLLVFPFPLIIFVLLLKLKLSLSRSRTKNSAK